MGGWVSVEGGLRLSLGPFLLFLACPSFLPLYTIVVEDLHDRPVSSRPMLQGRDSFPCCLTSLGLWSETPIGSGDTQVPEWDNLANHWLPTLVGYTHIDMGSEKCCEDQSPGLLSAHFLLSPGSGDEWGIGQSGLSRLVPG